MDKKIEQTYLAWLNEPALTAEEKLELKNIITNEEEIMSRFGSTLEFGTGGLRGIMGLGTNRMNRFVVRRATQGLANHLNKKKKHGNVVAIGYDSRNNSHAFAFEAANVLAANGIKVYIYTELMPTPAVSYAVRYHHCDAGIVVTASHNPAKYNGYKVYGADGAQLNLEDSEKVIKEVLAVDIFKDVKSGNFDKFVLNGTINFIDEDLIRDYFESTKKTALRNEEKIIKLTYTPLHGAGIRCVTTTLRELGYAPDVVTEQSLPNGDFPTCPYPNPEIKEALKLGIDLMLKNKNDILMATDPDSDRCGVVVNQKGKPIILTGNEVGILLFDYIYQTKKELGTLRENSIVVKTIVSSDLVDIMAEKYGVTVKSVLTGFKFIGEQIKILESAGEADRYLLGFEESCGYLTNPDVRDKDAVNACLLVAEMANHYKHLGKTLYDRLQEIYKEFGDYKTVTIAFDVPGLDYKEKISNIMEEFRGGKVNDLFGEVDHIGDYQKGLITFKDHEEETGLPKSNVIKLFLATKETITARPSGTEPKIKFYIFARGEKGVEKYNAIIDKYMASN